MEVSRRELITGAAGDIPNDVLPATSSSSEDYVTTYIPAFIWTHIQGHWRNIVDSLWDVPQSHQLQRTQKGLSNMHCSIKFGQNYFIINYSKHCASMFTYTLIKWYLKYYLLYNGTERTERHRWSTASCSSCFIPSRFIVASASLLKVWALVEPRLAF